MRTYFLKFPDEETALNILNNIPEILYIDDFGNTKIKINTNFFNIDVIGNILIHGEYNVSENGNINIITPPKMLDGWHINILINNDLYEFPEEIKKYIIPTPNNPIRIFG